MKQLSSLLAGLWLMWSALGAGAAAPPNIVFILADDLGYGDMGCYGATKVKTPHLDRLASQGCRFTDAHATASVCTPTRYALMTGRYAWRQAGTGIAAGDAPLLIPPGTTTVASLLKAAGYHTGLVGKWHLGLGDAPKTDFNGEIRPGPLELGFDEAFFIPATGDRVPCVFVENHRVAGYDPADPIRVSYGRRMGSAPTGAEPGVKLKIQGGPGHRDTIVNGIPRIGFMTGGEAARWVDEDIADTLTGKAVKFMEDHREGPFFLYLATHDIHEPMVPHPRYRGTSECGWRGDVIHQLDGTVGQVLAALDRLNLATNTLVIFTSDNGGALKNTYDDGTNPLHGRQTPNGALRGEKSSLYEGGHRVPFLARWPGHITPGSVSGELFGLVDTLATLAALTGQPLASGAGVDSYNVLPAWLGQAREGAGRDHLVLQNNNQAPLALREGNWMLLEKAGARVARPTTAEPSRKVPVAELYNLERDLGQTNNLAAKEPARVESMLTRLDQIRAQGYSRPTAADRPRLNVLFIMADDLRDYGGVFTRRVVRTPHLDRLAARSLRFECAFAQYPVCNPSRTSMFTGLRCEETGVVDNTFFFRSRFPDLVTLPQLFRQAGWFAGSYGKIYHVGEAAGEMRPGWTDEGRSWDEARMFLPTEVGRTGTLRDLAPGQLRWCQVGEMNGTDDDQPDGQNAAAAIAAIEKQTAAGRPWFIGAGFHKPHDPFFAPRKYFELYPKSALELYRDPTNRTAAPDLAIPKGWDRVFAGFGEADQRDFLRAYLAGVSFMDAQVGRLLDTLDRLRLWDRTVVVFLGDHGYHLGERGWWNKNTLFDRSCRAPLMVAAPGAARGKVYREPVEFVDLYPTLAGLAGLTAPHRLAGQSLEPVLRDPRRAHKEAAYTMVARGPERFGRSVRTERWRFTQWSDGSVELYDHELDAEETRNLAAQPEQAEWVARMKQRLQALPPWPAAKSK